MLRRLWQSYVGDVQRRVDAAAVGHVLHDARDVSHRCVVIVIVTVLLCLFGLKFFGSPSRIHNWIEVFRVFGLEGPFEALQQWVRSGPDRQFRGRLFWAAARAVAYLVIPSLVIWFLLRGRVRDYGFRAPESWRGR